MWLEMACLRTVCFDLFNCGNLEMATCFSSSCSLSLSLSAALGFPLSHSLAPHSHPSCSLIHSHTQPKCRWNFKRPKCFPFYLRSSHCLDYTHSDVHAVKPTLKLPALYPAPPLPSPTPAPTPQQSLRSGDLVLILSLSPTSPMAL